jgi:hypothetical protein
MPSRSLAKLCQSQIHSSLVLLFRTIIDPINEQILSSKLENFSNQNDISFRRHSDDVNQFGLLLLEKAKKRALRKRT